MVYVFGTRLSQASWPFRGMDSRTTFCYWPGAESVDKMKFQVRDDITGRVLRPDEIGLKDTRIKYQMAHPKTSNEDMAKMLAQKYPMFSVKEILDRHSWTLDWDKVESELRTMISLGVKDTDD